MPAPFGKRSANYAEMLDVAQRLVDLRTAPAVAQRDGDRALGGVLAHDVFVELADDLFRGHDFNSSIVRLRLV